MFSQDHHREKHKRKESFFLNFNIDVKNKMLRYINCSANRMLNKRAKQTYSITHSQPFAMKMIKWIQLQNILL